jgi:hypothetical protein
MSTAASVQTRTTGSAGFHLNRRGRFLFVGFPVILLSVLAAAAAVFFGAHGVAPASASADESAASPRHEAILRIGELNDLDGGELQPGQVLFVPAGA